MSARVGIMLSERIVDRKVTGLAVILLTVMLLSLQNCWASRGLRLQLKNPQGISTQNVDLYGGSYALLIGGSNYTKGWASLESVPRELAKVEKLLINKGFTVEKYIDPDHKKLSQVFENFIYKYGYDPKNRLLFFYSGHGYTRKDGRKGYLVPVDAPNPNKDEFGFISKSLSMNQILFWARDIEAKHAIFLFDSCFSGTIFKQRELPNPPRHITRLTTLPVRQFITAGMAGETVPAVSTFTPAFIDGLFYNLADLNGDGYVSGTELGLYLQEKVPQHTNQTPQFGKITDYELSRGDFIFVAGGGTAVNGSEASAPPAVSSQNVVREFQPPKQTNIEKGQLKVTSSPSGADVFFNGRRVGITPVQFGNIEQGEIEVTVSKIDYLAGKQTAHVNSGRKTVLNFEMMRQVKNGFLTIYSTPPGAKVRFVDSNRDYYPSMDLPAGKYKIEVSSPGYMSEMRIVNIAANHHLNMEVALEKPKVKVASAEKSPVTPFSSMKKMPVPEESQTDMKRQGHSAKIIARSLGFIVYQDGMIEDAKTKLMWPAFDNGKDISWPEADSYCRNYRGGGYSDWRMPTVEELDKLYAALFKKKTEGTGAPIKLSKYYIWSDESRGEKAAFYYFDTGHQLWFSKDHSRYLRVLPVRSVQ